MWSTSSQEVLNQQVFKAIALGVCVCVCVLKV